LFIVLVIVQKYEKNGEAHPLATKYYTCTMRFIVENDNNIPCGIKKAVQGPMFHLFLSIFAQL
jgi:hypothetical protein